MTSVTVAAMKSAEHRMMPKDASSLLPYASGKSSVGIENMSEDWTRFGKRQILSVGKKNEALHYNNEDDEIAAGDEYHSSSDEEDGRTAAGREKKKKSLTSVSTKINRIDTSPANNDATTSMDASTSQTIAKKNKKKKKEKKSNSMDNNTEMELASIGAITADQSNLAKIDARVDDDGLTASNEVPQNEETSNKKKRKKIRSRQKNIRKDHRTENDKPSHLIVGSDAYCGRPMTKETRQKLGIQHTAKKSARVRVNNDAFDSGEWVGDNKPDDNTDDVNADAKQNTKEGGSTIALTKIGDCIVNDDAKVDVGHDDVLPSSNDVTIKSTKKQKRRFKNLLV